MTESAAPSPRPVRPARLIDVARRAGVSRQTVSNAVNSPHLVRPETLGRVQAAIADLDYQTNLFAREMRLAAVGRPSGDRRGDAPPAGAPGRAAAVAVLLGPDLDGSVADDRVTGWLSAIAAAGATAGRPVLAVPGGDPDTTAELLAGWHAQVGLAGVVLDGTVPVPDDPRLAWCRDAEVAAVVLAGAGEADEAWWATVPAVTRVTEDADTALRLARSALAEAGHRRVVHVGLAAHGPVDGDLERSELADASPVTARRAVARLLARDARPTALVCDRPAVTLAAVAEVRAWGLTVGEDVAVVGLGDTAALAALEITAVAVPAADVAAACVTAVLAPPRADAPLVRRQHVLTPHLVRRASLVDR